MSDDDSDLQALLGVMPVDPTQPPAHVDCEHEPLASDEGGPVFCRKCQTPIIYPSGEHA